MSMSQSEISGWLSTENAKQHRVLCGEAEFHKGGMMTKSYVDFAVNVTVDGETVSSRHRFSEFESLRNSLKLNYANFGLIIPPLPSKGMTSLTVSTSDIEGAFVKERCEGLTLFCRGIVSNPFFRNDNAWLDFIGSSASSGDNVGERMISGAVALLEQPFKLTIDSRMETIKDEAQCVEDSVKAVLAATRKLQECEKACSAAFDSIQTNISQWNTNEVARVKCLNGYPFDAMESIVPNQQGVKNTVKNWTELDTNKYMARSMMPDQIAIFQCGALNYDVGTVGVIKESIAHRDQINANILSLGSKLEKAEKTAKDSKDAMKVEKLKIELEQFELKRENYYKGLLCLALPMAARLRAETYRVAYSYMGVSYLAESSQCHTACLAFFRSMSVNPMKAMDEASEALVEDGLIALNKTSTNYGNDQSLFQEGPVAAPLMHGLLECAISGNYGPLYQTAYTPPSAPDAAVDSATSVFNNMGTKFSDSESDGMAGGDRASTGNEGGGGGWADEESIGV